MRHFQNILSHNNRGLSQEKTKEIRIFYNILAMLSSNIALNLYNAIQFDNILGNVSLGYVFSEKSLQTQCIFGLL